MNVEIGTVAAQFLFWEYLFPIFGIGSLQCVSVHRFYNTDVYRQPIYLSVCILQEVFQKM
jgi:hypothetical protein